MKTPQIDFKNPKVQVAALLVCVGLLVGYLWYTNVIEPNTAESTKLEAENKARQTELNNIYAMMPQLKKLRADVALMNSQLDSLKSIFPDSKEVPRLIVEITRMSRESGIFTTKFMPGVDVPREYYTENNYSVSVIGGYHQLAVFFNDLANLELITNISKLKLMVNPAIDASIKDFEEHAGTVQTVFATFNLTTFSSKK